VAGTEFLRSEVGAVLTVLAIVVTVAVLSFVLYIGREEYGIARQEGRGRMRSVLRSIRVTFDSFVMGH
jgi:hypothetical protein